MLLRSALHVPSLALLLFVCVPPAHADAAPTKSLAAAPALPAAPSNLDVEAEAPLEKWDGTGKDYERAVDAQVKHGGAKSARLRFAGGPDASPKRFGTLSQTIDASSFRGKKVVYAGWLRTVGVTSGWAGLWLRVDSNKGEVVGFDNMQTSDRAVTGTTDWTRYQLVLHVPQDAKSIVLGAVLAGNGTIWMDDLSVKPSTANVPVTATQKQAAAGLVEAYGRYEISLRSANQGGLPPLRGKRPASSTPKLLIPVVLSYGDQVPITWRLAVTPKEKLVSTRITEDRPGNFVAEVVVGPIRDGDVAKLEWSSIVACGPGSFEGVPAHAAIPASWPEDARPWLKSTRSVKSDDECIRKIAAEVRGDSTDVMAIIARTLERTRTIYEDHSGQCTELGAVGALMKHANCVSRANLVAALLRANNVPARILSGYPAWSGPLQTHYIVEALVPGWGWYPIEPTMLRSPWPPYQQVAVAIIPPAYEDKSAPRSNVGGGVPYLSLTECPDDDGWVFLLGMADKSKDCDHEATLVRAFPADAPRADWDRALAAARPRWDAWIRSQPTAQDGVLEARLVSSAALEVAKDPAALAAAIGR